MQVANDAKLGTFSWNEFESFLEVNWGNELDFSGDIFNDFKTQDWKQFQDFLANKTGYFLGAPTWDKYEELIQLSDANPPPNFESIDSLKAVLANWGKSLELDQENSKKLIALAGTIAKLPEGPIQSGEGYSLVAKRNVEVELSCLFDWLKIGTKSNLIGNSFDDHLDAISLLSDFGKSALVSYLGDTPDERKLLQSWGPRKNALAFDMTAVLVAGLHSDIIPIPEIAVLNPRFVHLLTDSSNLSQPWWMEMALWATCAELWKERVQIGIEDLDLACLSQLLRNSLDPSSNTNHEALQIFSQDFELFENLLQFLEE